MVNLMHILVCAFLVAICCNGRPTDVISDMKDDTIESETGSGSLKSEEGAQWTAPGTQVTSQRSGKQLKREEENIREKRFLNLFDKVDMGLTICGLLGFC